MTAFYFICASDQNGCGHEFSIVCSVSDYTDEVECESCGKTKEVIRNYVEDTNSGFIKKSDTEIKVGHLASRNRDSLSSDEKDHIYKKHNEYRYKKSKLKLPKGHTVTEKQMPTRKEAENSKREKKEIKELVKRFNKERPNND